MDAKIRRQSIDPEDLFYAHIGSMDTCARTLIAVEKMINDGSYETFLKQRYESWNENSELMNKLSEEEKVLAKEAGLSTVKVLWGFLSGLCEKHNIQA